MSASFQSHYVQFGKIRRWAGRCSGVGFNKELRQTTVRHQHLEQGTDMDLFALLSEEKVDCTRLQCQLDSNLATRLRRVHSALGNEGQVHLLISNHGDQ